MPRTPSLRPQRCAWTGTRQWKVDLPGTISPTGKRERSFFETKAEAEGFAEKERIKLKNFGVRSGLSLSPAEQDQATQAFVDLKPYGVSLNEVVKDWLSRRKARDTTVTFLKAATEYMAWLEVRKIKGRAVSLSHRKRVRQTVARVEKLHDRPLTEINDSAIAASVSAMTPSVRNVMLAVLSAIFSWSADAPRKWVNDNPVGKVKKEDEGGGEVQIFTNRQVLKVIVACRRYDKDLLPYHLLGFFAGIRPEEMPRVKLDMIDLPEKHIVLPGSATKTGERRVIEMEETLCDWLALWVSENPETTGFIVPQKNLRRRLRALRERANVEWIQDGMRHTYASNWLAKFGDEHKLRSNMGHRSSSELWDHYHRAVTKREAERFWAIKPRRIQI